MSQPSPVHSPEPSPRGSGCLIAFIVGLIVIAIIFVVVLLVTLIVLPSRTEVPGHAPSAAVGQKLPELSLQPLTGAEQPVELADLRGRVALVNFWGTWCGPCRLEMPEIVALHKKYGDRADFKLLAVSCGPGKAENVEQLRAQTQDYLQESGFDLPTFTDPGMVTRNAFHQVGRFQGYPTTFIMDHEGVIRQVWVGYNPRAGQEMEALLESLLK